MNKNWSNTTLVAYSLLPKIVKELDRGLKNRVNSSFQSKHLKLGVSTEQLIDEILQINDEKRKMVNLRFIVSHALEGMRENYRNILVARIIDKKTFQEMSTIFNTTIRTIFRRLAQAEEEFEHNLNRAGYTEEWFNSNYGNDKYISPIHDRILNEKYFVAKNL